MALAYIPADGGPRALRWPLGFSAEEFESTSIPGPTGVPLPEDFIRKSLRVLAIVFKSDHVRKMTDKGYPKDHTKIGDFEAGGDPFPEYWTYEFNPDNHETRSYPVSHTGDKEVVLVVVVSNDYAHPVEASLTGTVTGSDVAEGMQFILPLRTFEPGVTPVRIVSNQPLRNQIQAAQFEVKWEFAGPRISSSSGSDPSSIYAPPLTTTNELFVTLGEPRFTGDEITYERMAHAVHKAGAAKHSNPHKIVEALVHSLKRNFGADGTPDPWFFARVPDTKIKVDCISLARYVAAIVKMVGIQGRVEPVIVYVQPKGPIRWEALVPWESDPKKRKFKGFPAPTAVQDLKLLDDVKATDFEVFEEPDPGGGKKAGLNKPMIHHPHEPWHLMLLLDFDVPNAFEGCVKFTPFGGKPMWYPAGTTYKGISKLRDVLRTFKSLSWIHNEGNTRQAFVEEYPPLPE